MSSPQMGDSTSYTTEHYDNGDCYMGYFVGEAKHGKGVYLFANGSEYRGSWEDGRMSGWGTFVNKETGDTFEGEWRAGEKVFGVYTFGNRDTYHGGFRQDMKQGRGVVWQGREMYEVFYDSDVCLHKKMWSTKFVEGSPQSELAALQAQVTSLVNELNESKRAHEEVVEELEQANKLLEERRGEGARRRAPTKERLPRKKPVWGQAPPPPPERRKSLPNHLVGRFGTARPSRAPSLNSSCSSANLSRQSAQPHPEPEQGSSAQGRATPRSTASVTRTANPNFDLPDHERVPFPVLHSQYDPRYMNRSRSPRQDLSLGDAAQAQSEAEYSLGLAKDPSLVVTDSEDVVAVSPVRAPEFEPVERNAPETSQGLSASPPPSLSPRQPPVPASRAPPREKNLDWLSDTAVANDRNRFFLR